MRLVFRVGQVLGDLDCLQVLVPSYATGIGERGFYHVLHFVERNCHAAFGLRILYHLGMNAQGREWRSQIMCQCGQHLRPIRDETGQPGLHFIERHRQVSYLVRSGRREWFLPATAPELLCGGGKLIQWPRQARQQKPEHRQE